MEIATYNEARVISNVMRAIHTVKGAGTMVTTSAVARHGGRAKAIEGRKVWLVRYIRNDEDVNELAQDGRNDIK